MRLKSQQQKGECHAPIGRKKFGKVIHDITEIKKELILHKSKKITSTQKKINTWISLGKKISTKWDDISAVDEVMQQREKS